MLRKELLLLVLVLTLLLTACTTLTVEDMRKDVETEFYYITISGNIGERRVKPDDYAMCGLDDAIKIKGYAYGKGYWNVECW